MLTLELMSHRVVPKLPRSFVAVLIFGLSFTGFGCDLGTWGKLAVVSRISPPPHEKDSVEWLSAVAAGQWPMAPATLSAQAKLRESLGAEYAVLAVHPGVVAHLDHFISFAKSESPMPPSVGALLSRYRAHLGKIFLERAVVLTDAEARKVEKQGLEPGMVRAGSSYLDAYRRIAREGLGAVIDSHMNSHGARVSPFASATEVGAIAVAVAHVHDPKTTQRHTFSVAVDVLDVVYLNVNANANLIEEALVFGPIPPSHMALLSKTTTNSFGTIDIVEELRYSRRSEPSVPMAFRPQVNRPSKN